MRLWPQLVAALLITLVPLTMFAAQGEDDFDVRHYNIRVQPDIGSRTLTVDTTMTVDNPASLRTFTFLLNSRFSVVTAEIDRKTARISRDSDIIEIASPVPPRPRHRIHIHASGTLGNSNDENRAVITDEDVFLLSSDRWYPSHPNDWSTVTTTIALPPQFHAIGPGVLHKTRSTATGPELTFDKRAPAENFSLFADRGWKVRRRTVQGIRIQTLLDECSDRFADQIFESSADVIRYFAELHGFVPFEQFSFVTLRGTYARRAFTDFVGYEPSFLEKEMARTGYDAHETSLLWWIYATHGRGPGSFQWTEGLGDYVEVMYAEARQKPLAANFERFRRQYLEMPVTDDVALGDLRGNTPQRIVHGKYPWTMQVLRVAIGDDAFRRGLRSLFSKYRYRSFTIDEFVAVFEEVSGTPLQWWRTEWLERKGVPELAIDSTVAAGQPDRIVCRIRFIGEVYHLPVEIGIETAHGMEIRRVLLDQKEQSFTFDVAQPQGAVIDPNRRIALLKVSG